MSQRKHTVQIVGIVQKHIRMSAGVDMSTPKPVDDALNVFEDYLKQFEAATK